ncbi:MAG: hypothetical protein U1E76_03180 [Planctomycetota bacterium]
MYSILNRLLAAALAAGDTPDETSAALPASDATTLTGTIMLGDSRLACEHFGVFLRNRASNQVDAVSGEAGRFHCAVEPGAWDLAIVAPGYDVYEHRIAVQPGSGNTLGVVRLRPGSGRICVEVVDADGVPLADQRILLARVVQPQADEAAHELSVKIPQPVHSSVLDEDVVSERTDEAGRACFASVPDGPMLLTVAGDAALWVPAQLILCAGEQRQVRLTRPVARELTINLTDAAGARVLIDTIRLERGDSFRMHATCAANFCCRSLGEDCELAGLVAFPRLASLYHVWVSTPAGSDPVVLGAVPTGDWSITINADGRSVTRHIEISAPGARIDVQLPEVHAAVAAAR